MALPPNSQTSPPSAPGARTGAVDRLASFVRRRMIWLLVSCYLVATIWPHAGIALRSWQLTGRHRGEIILSLPLVLLALLLFCASLVTKIESVSAVLRRPASLLCGLAGVWLGPVLFSLIASNAIREAASAGVLVGLALVATMPVANSSVGWAHSARGNLALSLGLIVLSISLSPLVAPNLLQLLGLSLSPTEKAYCDALVERFSGAFFIVWVILPTLLGLACRGLFGGCAVDRFASQIALTSAAVLLLLNYINAALALPQVLSGAQWALLATAIGLATGLSLVGILLAVLLAKILCEPPDVRSALLFGLSMKHTGLALVLAGAVLDEQPAAILMIVVATVMQHIIAGSAHWFLTRAERRIG